MENEISDYKKLLPQLQATPMTELIDNFHSKAEELEPEEFVIFAMGVKKAEKLVEKAFGVGQTGIKLEKGKAFKKKVDSALEEYQDEHGILPDGLSKVSSANRKYFNWSECNHPEYLELKAAELAIKTRLKIVEKELQTKAIAARGAKDTLKGGTFTIGPDVVNMIKEQDCNFEIVPNGQEFVEVTLPTYNEIGQTRFTIK